MAKWEKYADELEGDEALPKAPEFQDTVVDVVDPADATMPPEIRGCQVIERRHPGAGAEVFYCRPDGATFFEAQANELIAVFRAAAAGGAPPVETVIDTLGTGDDVPPQLRGARLVDRGGEFVFLTTDGGELPKEIGDSLFDVFDSPEVTNPGLHLPAVDPVPMPTPPALEQAASVPEPQPAPEAADTVIDTLGTGQDVPPMLRGAKLVDRGGSFYFLTAQGEAVPKEIGDDLFEAWDAPDAPEASATAPEAAPEPETAPAAEAEAETLAAAAAPAEAPPTVAETEAEATFDADAPPAEPSSTAVEEEIIEFLGSGEDVPPRLRSGRLVRRVDGFYYVTSDDEVIPAEIGEGLIAAWNPDAETPAETLPAAQATAPNPVQKPFGYDDFGPVTIPNAEVPDTIDVARGSESAALADEAPAVEPTAVEPTAAEAPIASAAELSTERLESGRLEDQLKQAVTMVRRAAATGGFDVGEATPTQAQLEALIAELVSAEPADAMLSRMVRRSIQLTEQISEAWAGDENRSRQALHRDVVSGTLLLVAVNPTQLKDLDVLGLLTLLRLRTAEGNDRVVGELAKSLRAKLIDDLSRAIKAASLTDQVLLGARSTAGVVTAGRLWPEGVAQLVAQTVTRHISLTVGEVLGSYREKGYAFPGLAEKVLEAYRHFATDIGERVANAIE